MQDSDDNLEGFILDRFRKESAVNMKKAWIMALGILMISNRSAWAEQSIGESEHLDNINQLYKFAWGLQYPEEGPYDIWLICNAQGITQSMSNIPRTTLGYQIRDFDQDGQMELLVAGLNEESDSLDLRIYEIQDGNVVLQSETATGGMAVLPEDGILRCYSYLTEQNQRMIGCDLWSYVGYVADGTSTSTELFLYDGASLTKIDGYGVSGSSIGDDVDIVGNYNRLGINNVNAGDLLNGTMTGCQYVFNSEVFVEVQNKLLDYDADAYLQWLNSNGSEYYIIGGTYVKSYCWLPSDIVNRTWGRQQLPQLITQKQQEQEEQQLQIKKIVDESDYLYVSYSSYEQGAQDLYYLVPDEGKTIYQCYDINGKLCYNIAYDNAKDIVDQALGECDGLPSSGERCAVVWNSPYGLCAYDHYYRDYYPFYMENENGDFVEVPKDLAELEYTFDESDIKNLIDNLKLTVPNSGKEQ